MLKNRVVLASTSEAARGSKGRQLASHSRCGARRHALGGPLVLLGPVRANCLGLVACMYPKSAALNSPLIDLGNSKTLRRETSCWLPASAELARPSLSARNLSAARATRRRPVTPRHCASSGGARRGADRPAAAARQRPRLRAGVPQRRGHRAEGPPASNRPLGATLRIASASLRRAHSHPSAAPLSRRCSSRKTDAPCASDL